MSDQLGGTLELIAHIVQTLMGGIVAFAAVWAFKIGVFKTKLEDKQKQRDEQQDRIEQKVELLGSNHMHDLGEKMDTLKDTVKDGTLQTVQAILSLKGKE